MSGSDTAYFRQRERRQPRVRLSRKYHDGLRKLAEHSGQTLCRYLDEVVEAHLERIGVPVGLPPTSPEAVAASMAILELPEPVARFQV